MDRPGAARQHTDHQILIGNLTGFITHREDFMHGLEGEQVLMRIHIGESDKYEGESLYKAIIKLLHDRKYAGATAFRGIMGFGASTHMHSSAIELLSFDLPIVVECVETEERIQSILPDLDRMMGGGLITLERAHVIVYRPHADADTSERGD